MTVLQMEVIGLDEVTAAIFKTGYVGTHDAPCDSSLIQFLHEHCALTVKMFILQREQIWIWYLLQRVAICWEELSLT